MIAEEILKLPNGNRFQLIHLPELKKKIPGNPENPEESSFNS